MKNLEKYKTEQEALDAFDKECATHLCSSCPYAENGDPYRCEIRWLYEEKEELTQWQKNMMGKFTRKD